MRGVTPARFLTLDTEILPGVRRQAVVPNPAAGSDWTFTVPGGCIMRMLGGTATLTTSATVANRNLGMVTRMFGQPVQLAANTANITASSTATPLYQLGTTTNLLSVIMGYSQIVFVTQWLNEGDSISSFTTNLQAADQYSGIYLAIEEVRVTNEQLTELQAEKEQREAQEASSIAEQIAELTGTGV